MYEHKPTVENSYGTARSNISPTVISPTGSPARPVRQQRRRKPIENGGRTVHPNYRWISSVRAAEALGVSIRDLYRLIDRGDLPAYRIASEIRLLAHEVDDFHEKFPDARDLL